MISNKAVGSMTLVIIGVAGLQIFAAEKTAVDFYGQGVHAYYASDYETAISLLDESIKMNKRDPRPHYFRGLALASSKGVEAGLADFAKAAEVELTRADDERNYNVNLALQRVQGRLRLALEKERSTVRLAAAVKKEKQDRVRYERLKRREDVVLFNPDQPLKKIDMKLPLVDLGNNDPFANGVAFTGGKPVKMATVAPIEPAADTAAQTAGPGGEIRDPFAAPAEDPAPEEPNPFGDMAPVAKKPAATKPAQAEAELDPGDANPFGDGMVEIDPEDPVFDESVRPELPAGMNVGGSILDLLGKTLSGEPSESADRDPFGEDAPAAPPKKDPATEEPKPKQEEEPDPDVNPFG